MNYPTPAFPSGNMSGMDLRDWFAGQALAALVAHVTDDSYPEGCHANSSTAKIAAGWAKLSYRYADAMIAERSKR